jgi:hypothetical protein
VGGGRRVALFRGLLIVHFASSALSTRP